MILTFKNAELFRKWAYFQPGMNASQIEFMANYIEMGYKQIEISGSEASDAVLQSPIPNSVNS